MDKQAILNALARLASQANDFQGNEEEETFLECFGEEMKYWMNQAALCISKEEVKHGQSEAAA